jgi:hypothetical protein
MTDVTKREVLLAICELPGWAPPEDSAKVEVHLAELIREGWTCPRLDGYEATQQALDAYPAFPSQADLSDPYVTTEAVSPASGDTIPTEQVLRFVIGLLGDVPIVKLYQAATRQNVPQGTMIREVALAVVEAMK